MIRSMTKYPDELRLELNANYFAKDDPEALAYCETRNAMYDKAVAGTLYVKFVDGDRKGSIARVHVDPNSPVQHAQLTERYYSRWNQDTPFEIDNKWIYGTAKWDKRKNSCQVTIPHKDIVLLPNYEGPTIYQMFDKKAAKEELLQNPGQHDIDGKLLSIGDQVLYINARYGSGFVLCHGTIKEFKVSVDSKGHSFTTIVQNVDGKEESSISYPHEMIWKKP